MSLYGSLKVRWFSSLREVRRSCEPGIVLASKPESRMATIFKTVLIALL
jgi:hypothetical protein